MLTNTISKVVRKTVSLVFKVIDYMLGIDSQVRANTLKLSNVVYSTLSLSTGQRLRKKQLSTNNIED